ncbi:MAG: hypothetical protein ACLU0O_02035 [Collinsella sp.]
MIDTEHVKCDTCTAPTWARRQRRGSRGWPTVDIETNLQGAVPLFQQHPEIAPR